MNVFSNKTRSIKAGNRRGRPRVGRSRAQAWLRRGSDPGASRCRGGSERCHACALPPTPPLTLAWLQGLVGAGEVLAWGVLGPLQARQHGPGVLAGRAAAPRAAERKETAIRGGHRPPAPSARAPHPCPPPTNTSRAPCPRRWAKSAHSRGWELLRRPPVRTLRRGLCSFGDK